MRQIDSLAVTVTCSFLLPRFVLAYTIYFKLNPSVRDCGTDQDPRVRGCAATFRPSKVL